MSITRQRACEQCGTVFPRDNRLSNKQWAARRFCSQRCTGVALKAKYYAERPPLRVKFERMFQKTDGCWEWQGTIEGYGYGVIDHNWQRYRAHVLALQFDGRPVPKGMFACHHCDNPKCVRPDHLYVGTAQQNADDAKARDRLPRGSAHSQAKLTEGDVRKMRKLKLSKAEIARRFGVSRPTAARAVSGQTWGHVK